MPTPLRSVPGGAALSAFAVLTALSIFVAPAQAQRKERQGKDVVDAVCSGCHLQGKDNAPRIGDVNAWSVRASQGLTALTNNAVKGIRNMPAHGGNAGVSDIEIERAITYMVNQSGGHWVEPVGGGTPAVVRTSESIVRAQCATCHESGRDGAPKIGDQAAWIPRLKRGLDPLVASAVHGHGPMPSRGGLPDLSDAEIRGAIVYMFSYGVPPAAPPAPAAAADPHHKVVSGTDIYLGMTRAESMRAAYDNARSNDKPAIPSGKGYYHVNISLVDSKSQVPVTDAQVKVLVSDGMTSETHTLGLLGANNTVSYGSFYRFSSGSAYNITAEIRRPGMAGTIEAKFDFRAP
jgi:cytochrome c5